MKRAFLITAAQPQLNLPSDVVFLFSEACSSQHAGAFTEVTNKVVTEVEGNCNLIRTQPPVEHQRIHFRDTSYLCFFPQFHTLDLFERGPL